LKHVFVVPAFGRPRWLERCLDSLQRQSRASEILVTTSTPNALVASVCSQRAIPLIVNPVSGGIASDWNFALERGGSDWVTLAHQDDWYSIDYTQSILDLAAKNVNTVLAFTAATEIVEGSSGRLINPLVKRAICDAVFLGAASIASGFRKRLLLSFGNPIPCPAVALNRRLLPQFKFRSGWHSNLDWIAWLELSSQPGEFGYVRRPLVHRTLHPDGATKLGLTHRTREDGLILAMLWPRPISTILGALYAAGRSPYKRFRRS
jgi:glycosyltransferase involved in cell wall biosynthesis